jgi:MYXO-CTERM domain-containing protein
MAGIVGTRVNSSSAAAASNLGVWCAHFVIAPGNAGSRWWNATAASKDGLTGATITNTGTMDMVPAPGALALLGVAGFASRRRRA